MSTAECPPTPPQLPTGDDARTPPPKDAPGSSVKPKLAPDNRPGSPDPNCAICLGNLENMSYTDSCFHKFCFTCLLEWSKVSYYFLNKTGLQPVSRPVKRVHGAKMC